MLPAFIANRCRRRDSLEVHAQERYTVSYALKPEQLMLNIASGTLPQRDALACMRLFAQQAMPALRSL